MSFPTKPDYFGLATTNTNLTLKSSALNKTASVADAKNAHGDVIAREVYGETAAPTVSYELKDDTTLNFTLGKITTVDSKKYCLASVSINTALATPPTFECTGEMVEDAATDANSTQVDLSSVSIEHWHDAQILATAFTLTGTGCYLNSCSYTLAADITKATVDGVCVAHDVSNGRIEVTATIVQSGSTAPTVTAGSGWTITSPLTNTNPDEDYPTWTLTLAKTLTATHPTT